MREMKESGIGWIKQIPKDWNVERLQWHLYEIKAKNNPIQTKAVLSLTKGRGVIPYEEKGAQGNVSKENYREYNLAYKDTIVANSMNILIGSVGYSNYFGCVSPVYYVFKEKYGNNLSFINYIMQTTQFQKELRKYANGILEIRMRVSADDILKRMAAFPSLSEQDKIVFFLNKKCGEIDSISADIHKQIETLEQYKASVISEAVTKGLNPNVEFKDSGVATIGCMPKNWVLGKFKHYAVICNGKDYKGYESESGKYPIIGSGGEFLRTNRYLYNKESVLLGRKGTVDKPLYVNFPFWTVDTMFYTKINSNVCGKYFYYLCLIIDFKFYQTQTTIPSMTQADLNNIKFPIPKFVEQQQIADYLDKKCGEIDSIIADKKSQLEVLEEYKKSLIYEYVTGKKEVAE